MLGERILRESKVGDGKMKEKVGLDLSVCEILPLI